MGNPFMHYVTESTIIRLMAASRLSHHHIHNHDVPQSASCIDSSSDDSSSSNKETEKAQAAKKVKRKKARELAQDIEADRVCYITEEEAFKTEVADATVDNSLPKVGTLVCISFENCIWFNIGMLLWVNHRDCFEEQLRYLQNDLADEHN